MLALFVICGRTDSQNLNNYRFSLNFCKKQIFFDWEAKSKFDKIKRPDI